MSRKIGIAEAKQKAGRFCAFRERSPKEVKDKLKSWGLSEAQVLEVFYELQEQGFVNAQRFANAYCHDKFEFNSWGRIKIRFSIHAHQLDADVIEEALRTIDDEKYDQRLIMLARQKWKSLEKETELNRRQKIASYLTGKGFESDMVRRTITAIEAGTIEM